MPEWRDRVRARLADLRLDPATEEEVVLELAQHLEDRYRDLIAGGQSDEKAADLAWAELEADPRLAREIARSRTPLVMAPPHDVSRNGLTAIWDDLVFAWRRLRFAPAFTIVALLTVMLTVGVNTAILSIADAVLFRPLPYTDPDSVAVIRVRDKKTGQQTTLTPYIFLNAINAGCPSVSEVALLEPYDGRGKPPILPTRETPDGPARVSAVEVTANYFQLLGVRPAYGRIFDERDSAREGEVAMLSHVAWLQLFGGDKSVVGKPITLGAATFDLVGVLPAGFVFPSNFARGPSLIVVRGPLRAGESGGTFHPIVRIAKGVTFAQAQAEIESATASVTVPTTDDRVKRELARWTSTVPALNEVRAMLYPVGRPIMRLLLAASGFILLLGCANLANMMLVRGRRGLADTAVRLALGASRARLVRPLIFEALIVGLGGALLAVALTSATFEALLRQVPPLAYGRADVGVDTRVLLISLAMGLFCALSFSIVPAWRASGVDVLSLIQRRGGRGARVRLGRPLIALQVAIAVAVVFGAIVAARAFVSILRIPVGFSAERVLLVSPGRSPGMTGADFRVVLDRVMETLAARPDVEAVGAVGSLPFSGSAPNDGIPGADGRFAVGLTYALPGYFEVVGITPIRGRVLTRADTGDPGALVLSDAAAKTLFGEQDPIGRTVAGRDQVFHVIGVVGNVRNAIDRESPPIAYSLPPAGRGLLQLVAKVRSRSEATLAAIKADARAQNPRALTTAEWWEDSIAADNAYRDPRFQTLVLTSLGSLALGLTALGIFSVVAYLVAARTREMGVRMALGASPHSLVGLVVRQTLVPVAVGAAAGFLLIAWGKSLAEAQLFSVKTSDPFALSVAAVTVLGAALAAAYLPARRATKINPTLALRAE